MNRVSIMHITCSLNTGGFEKMAVNMVNCLPRDRYLVHLCTTRQDGPLAELVAGDVTWLRLERRQRFDVGAIRRLVAFIRANHVQVLHAHDTALFIAAVASLFPPYPAVIWHDNYGLHGVEERPLWLYRPAARRVSAIIAANQQLAEWSRLGLGKPAEQVWYIPNFVSIAAVNGKVPELPGTPGNRIVCVANLRAQKDHLSLLRAISIVVQELPRAHLLLVGAPIEQDCAARVLKEIVDLGLSQNVTWLGQRLDVSAILQACDVAVLSSASEGLPLALLEYGLARLPAVATSVGQCAEVLNQGRAGILVPPHSPEQLAEALLSLLRSPERRLALGYQLYRRVHERYTPDAVIKQVCQVYETVLSLEHFASRRPDQHSSFVNPGQLVRSLPPTKSHVSRNTR